MKNAAETGIRRIFYANVGRFRRPGPWQGAELEAVKGLGLLGICIRQYLYISVRIDMYL